VAQNRINLYVTRTNNYEYIESLYLYIQILVFQFLFCFLLCDISVHKYCPIYQSVCVLFFVFNYYIWPICRNFSICVYLLISQYCNIRIMKTNLMHHLSSVYFVNQPLHVSGVFVAYHQEVPSQPGQQTVN